MKIGFTVDPYPISSLYFASSSYTLHLDLFNEIGLKATALDLLVFNEIGLKATACFVP
jgi:hypothetical protein